MTYLLEGIAISPGYAEGVAVVYDYEMDYRLEFPDRDILASDIGKEHGRLDDATEKSHRELQQAGESTNDRMGTDDAAVILAVHTQLVREIATPKEVRQLFAPLRLTSVQRAEVVAGSPRRA